MCQKFGGDDRWKLRTESQHPIPPKVLEGNSDFLCLSDVRSRYTLYAAYAVVGDIVRPEWTADNHAGIQESIARLSQEFQAE